MRRRIILFNALVVVLFACKQQPQVGADLILIKGGPFINTSSSFYHQQEEVNDFYIGDSEVTQKEWMEVMGNQPSTFTGDSLPVESISWYDCIRYCNQRSIKEGLEPYYTLDEERKDLNNISEFDSLKYTVIINPEANGYRLPTEREWDYAAGGGSQSKNYTYSGGNNIEDLAWYWQNSGDSTLSGTWSWALLEKNNCRTQVIKRKKPNELGLYDMSGNVREWCQDWYEDNEIKKGSVRVQRGGGWIGAAYRCESSNRHSFEASGKGPDQGFRLCRSKR